MSVFNKFRGYFSVLILAILCGPMSISATGQYTNTDAINYFGQANQYIHATLSPKGDHYALWRMDGDHPVSLVYETPSDESSENGVTSTRFDLPPSLFNWQNWVDDKTLIISVTTISPDSKALTGELSNSRKSKRRKLEPSGLLRKLYAANISTGDMKPLLTLPLNANLANGADDFLHRLPSEPDHFMIAFSPGGGDYPGVYKVNFQTGETIEVTPPEEPFVNWSVDQKGELRLASGWGEEQLEIKIRAVIDKPWESLSDHPMFENGRFNVIGYSDDGNNLYVRSSLGKGRSVIYLFDMKRRAIRKKIFEHPKYDAGTLVLGSSGEKILGATYIDDRPQIEIFDEDFAKHRKNISDALGTNDFYIVDYSDFSKRSLIEAGSASSPGSLYLFDGNTEKITALDDQLKGRAPEAFAIMNAVSYFSRDGLEIPAYLTLPPNRKDEEKIPMILMPHGGPWVRDMQVYDNWVQFFANRGYGVLQPNFRGSTGYGDYFEAQGYGEWGEAMQNDITDGAEWLISQGYTDKQHLCIVGASYGGYAALMATVRSPDIFQCSVSIAPVTDLNLWIETISSSKAEREVMMRRTVGGVKDKLMTKQSPAYLAKKIKTPILLVHGTADIRVAPEHGRRMEKVLKKYKKDHSVLWLNGGSHFILQEQHRKQLFLSSLEFLQKHIGP